MKKILIFLMFIAFTSQLFAGDKDLNTNFKLSKKREEILSKIFTLASENIKTSLANVHMDLKLLNAKAGSHTRKSDILLRSMLEKQNFLASSKIALLLEVGSKLSPTKARIFTPRYEFKTLDLIAFANIFLKELKNYLVVKEGKITLKDNAAAKSYQKAFNIKGFYKDYLALKKAFYKNKDLKKDQALIAFLQVDLEKRIEKALKNLALFEKDLDKQSEL